MRSNLRLLSTLSALCSAAAVSCGPAPDTTDVSFGMGRAIGRWDEQTADLASPEPNGPSIQVDSASSSGRVVPTMSGAAGRGAPVDVAPQGHAGGAATTGPSAEPTGAGAGGSGSPSTGADNTPDAMVDAGAGGAAQEPSAAVGVTSLAFEVTTSPAGGRYQPRNIGAIWIEDDSGNFVKTLEVWAASRRRYLTGYLGAQGGGTIDVSTSATLRSHQTHTVTWDLKDRDGADVPPGAYSVKMELTDANTAGKSNTVDFDTTMGPVTLTPPDAASFGSMKLELQ